MQQTHKSSFGKRSPLAPANGPRAGVNSLPERPQLDLMRAMAADAIELWQSSAAERHPGLLVAICRLQDQIVKLKFRHRELLERHSKLVWVDSWRP